MVEKIVFSLGDLVLFGGMLWLLAMRLWGETSTKACFHCAKVTILCSIVFSILFYNKGSFPEIFDITPFNLLFYTLVSAIAFAWFSLSYRWFAAEGKASWGFCFLGLAALECLKVIIGTVNLGLLFSAMTLLYAINYGFLRISQESEELHNISGRYGWSGLLFIVTMFLALAVLTPFQWSYASAAEYISTANPYVAAAIVSGILMFLLYHLGIAPFHFWVSDVVSPAILPVAAYFNLVPAFALWGVFIKLNARLFISLSANLSCAYEILGVLSVVIGAVGANASRNLRKIFAYSGLYNAGIIVLMMSSFTPSAVLGGFVGMQAYILAMFGIYAAFYSFKSGGEYLSNLTMINGIFKVRPYIGGALLFFMASLMAIAPLPGFLQQWAALEVFAVNGNYGLMLLVLVSMLILMVAFLQIVRAVYFSKREIDFDRPDYGVYIYLLANMAIITVLIFKPQFLLHDAAAILNTVLR